MSNADIIFRNLIDIFSHPLAGIAAVPGLLAGAAVAYVIVRLGVNLARDIAGMHR